MAIPVSNLFERGSSLGSQKHNGEFYEIEMKPNIRFESFWAWNLAPCQVICSSHTMTNTQLPLVAQHVPSDPPLLIRGLQTPREFLKRLLCGGWLGHMDMPNISISPEPEPFCWLINEAGTGLFACF